MNWKISQNFKFFISIGHFLEYIVQHSGQKLGELLEV